MKPWLRKWVGRGAGPDTGRPIRSRIEALEDRVTPAVVTWDGAPDSGGTSANADWTTPANWVGDAVPTPGDTLVFPAGPTSLAPANTFPAGTPFALSITGPGYTLSGNAVGLAGTLQSSGGSTVVAAPLVLTGDAGVGASSGTLILTAGIDLGAHTLTLDAAEPAVVTLGGGVSGAGGLAKTGTGEAVLAAGNTFAGPTLVSGGVLRVTRPDALGVADGTAATGTTVAGPGSVGTPRLVLDGTFTVPGERLVLGGELHGARNAGWAGDIVLSSDVEVFLSAEAGATLEVAGTLTGAPLHFRIEGLGTVRLTGSGDISSGGTPVGLLQVAGSATLQVDGVLTGYADSELIGTVGGSGVLAGLLYADGSYSAPLSGGPIGGLAVAGAVRLNEAELRTAFDPAAGVADEVVLIDNDGADPVDGMFAGLPEGAVLTPAGGTYYRISYVGGDGNDVVLSRIAVSVWDGGGSNNLWTTAANWVGDTTPAAGATLVFPAGAARSSSVNDFTAGTSFAVLLSGPGYILGGNSLSLVRGGLQSTGGDATVQLPLSLGGATAISGRVGTLVVGPVDLAGNTLTIDAGADVRMTGVISGSGGPVKTGRGTAVLDVANTYSGPTLVTTGILRVRSPQALGATDGTAATGTTVAALVSHGVPLLTLDGDFRVAGERLDLGGGPSRGGELRGEGTAAWEGDVVLAPLAPTYLTAGAGGSLEIAGALGGSPQSLNVWGEGEVVVAGGGVVLGELLVAPTAALRVDGTLTGYQTSYLNGTVGGSGTLGSVDLVELGRFVAVATGGATDGLAVTGTVALNGRPLSFVPGYVPAVGDVLTLIDNDGADPVVGTFAGLPEGAVFTPDLGGTYYRISYAGGGNDVTLTTLAANHAPVLTPASPALGGTDEDTAVTFGPAALVNAGAGTTTVTDADAPADLRGVALVGTTGRGTWSYSLDGSAFAPVGAVSELSALLLGGAAVLRYQPDGANGEAPTVTYRAWDQSHGAAGDRTPVAGAVLTSAFSAAADTAALAVTGVNDAPTVVGGTPLALDGTDEDTASPPTPVAAILAAAAYADVDAGAAAGVAVTGVTGRGVWQFSADGATWTDFGPVAGGHALLLATGGWVRYRPDLLNGETAGLTYRAWDRTTGTASASGAPAYADPGVGGGTSAFSAATHAAQITVADRNDAPTAVVPSAAAVAENTAAGTPVGTLSATDPDTTPQTFTYALVAGDGAADNARFTVVGAELRLAEASDFESRSSYSVRVRVTDQGGLAFERAFTVTVLDVNEAPTGPGALSATAHPGEPFTYTLSAGAFTDPDAGDTLTYAAGALPAWLSFDTDARRLTGTPGTEDATAHVAVTAADAAGATGTLTLTVFVVPPAGPPDLGPVRSVVVGGAADGTVRLVAADGTEAVVAPFGDTRGAPSRTVSADVDGDGIADVVAVTGPGTGLRVAVLSGADGRVLVPAYDPFGGSFSGGGFVSAADLDGDGRAEFVVTPDQGGGPRVSVVRLNPDGSTSTLANFLGIDDVAFRGGARAAVGDVNHDGVPDLIVAAGFGGGPRVSVYDGRTVGGTPTRLINDFFAFPGADAQNLRNGAFAAVGDVTGDGFADLVFGGGPGGAPRVFILSGALIAAGDVDAAYAAPVANFFAGGDATARGGARVGVTNSDGDAQADVVVGSGPGEPARVRLYLGEDLTGGGEPPSTDLDPFDGAVLADGVYVG